VDDKSMQLWINEQLTAGWASRTIVGVARPTKTTNPSTYRRQFFQRVKAARVSASKNPLEMAQLLGVPKDTYHRYETRTMLPHHLIPLFCELTNSTAEWLVTGTHPVQPAQQQTPGTGTHSR
jgi:DNA-binding XRE family transcriptional regulator